MIDLCCHQRIHCLMHQYVYPHCHPLGAHMSTRYTTDSDHVYCVYIGMTWRTMHSNGRQQAMNLLTSSTRRIKPDEGSTHRKEKSENHTDIESNGKSSVKKSQSSKVSLRAIVVDYVACFSWIFPSNGKRKANESKSHHRCRRRRRIGHARDNAQRTSNNTQQHQRQQQQPRTIPSHIPRHPSDAGHAKIKWKGKNGAERRRSEAKTIYYVSLVFRLLSLSPIPLPLPSLHRLSSIAPIWWCCGRLIAVVDVPMRVVIIALFVPFVLCGRTFANFAHQ